MPLLPRRSVSSLVVLCVASACSSSKPTPAPAPQPSAAVATAGATATATAPDSVATVLRGVAPAAPKGRADRSVLTRDEIRATQFTNMYDVLRSLRGNWMRTRTAESINGKSATLQVYLDMQRLAGGMDELKQINPTNVESVRFFDPIQASGRWGMDHGAGAVMITTSKRPG